MSASLVTPSYTGRAWRLLPERPIGRRAVVAVLALLALVSLALALRGVDRTEKHIAAVPTAVHHVFRIPPKVEEQKLLDVAPATAFALNAALPLSRDPLVPASPYRFAGPAIERDRAVDCLAAAGWYEAGDDATGERAVMQVVLNRARHPAFRPGICGVVFQGSERATGCQFTFTCDGAITRRTPSAASWARARKLAGAAIDGAVDPDVGYATHYHADYVIPYWASANDKVAVVGPHIFYRWKGFWGTRAAFSRAPDRAEPAVAALAALSPAHAAGTGLPLSTAAAPVVAAPATATALASAPIAVEGVREKSLRGALVRGAAADSGRFFLQLDPATFPGNYATAAVALCRNKPSCIVLGWRHGEDMAQSLPLSDAQRQALSFYFVQNGSDDRTLWNCQQTPRSNAAQCLSPNGSLPTLNG